MMEKKRFKLALLGDFHIPERAKEIPGWIVERIKKEKPDAILCTGDLESEQVLDRLKELARTYCVQGNMDWLDLPEHLTLDLGKIKIGMIHGHRIHPRGDLNKLSLYAEKMGADILVHGHTHKLRVDLKDGKLYLNPGTATGSWGGATDGEPETFIMLEKDGKDIVVRKFTDSKEEVEEYEWTGNGFRKKQRDSK